MIVVCVQKSRSNQATVCRPKPLTVAYVFERLKLIASLSGPGVRTLLCSIYGLGFSLQPAKHLQFSTHTLRSLSSGEWTRSTGCWPRARSRRPSTCCAVSAASCALGSPSRPFWPHSRTPSHSRLLTSLPMVHYTSRLFFLPTAQFAKMLELFLFLVCLVKELRLSDARRKELLDGAAETIKSAFK